MLAMVMGTMFDAAFSAVLRRHSKKARRDAIYGKPAVVPRARIAPGEL